MEFWLVAKIPWNLITVILILLEISIIIYANIKEK